MLFHNKVTTGCVTKRGLMQCPFCLHAETKVLDKRDAELATKRRRECLKCARRFSTREALEWSDLRVIKKDGKREPFNREKIKIGIFKACEKRPVTEEHIETMVNMIEEKLRKRGKEVSTTYIGELVSKELKKADSIAYIRFASVYRNFADISDFKREIRGLLQR